TASNFSTGRDRQLSKPVDDGSHLRSAVLRTKGVKHSVSRLCFAGRDPLVCNNVCNTAGFLI
ncbi:MAG: hypothetical protein IJ802_01675, partial [Kiritimatiellae bacterium]|nr:hypothetical protein [Kiritimatiellia bacterium]